MENQTARDFFWFSFSPFFTWKLPWGVSIYSRRGKFPAPGPLSDSPEISTSQMTADKSLKLHHKNNEVLYFIFQEKISVSQTNVVLILKISIINRSIGNVWKAVHKVLTWGCIRQKPAGQNRQKLTHLHDKHFWPSMKPKLKPVWVILYSLCKSHITSLGNWKTI